MISRINFGPRLDCFTTSPYTADAQQEPSNSSSEQEQELQSWNRSTFTSDTSEYESVLVKSNQVRGERQESVSLTRSKTPREDRMLRPLCEQLEHVTKLAKLTSWSRMDMVTALVNAHSTFDAIEDMVKRTKEEVLGTLNSIENRIIAEDSHNTAHTTKVCETLQPVHQKFAALREVRASLAPLMEKVPCNDATTNRFRTNATTVKQITAQLNDLDKLRIRRWERPPVNDAAADMLVLVAELVTTMSSLRESFGIVDKFLSRSDKWHSLRSTMELQTAGIEKYFLEQCPPHSLSEYVKRNCPTSSQSLSLTTSGLSNTSKELRQGSKDIRLEPWTSASAKTTMRTSCVSSSEVLSAKMTSEIMQSYEDEGHAVETGVDRGRIGVRTLSDCSSFEDAELLTSNPAILHQYVPPQGVNISPRSSEDIQTAIECASDYHAPCMYDAPRSARTTVNALDDFLDVLLETAAANTPFSNEFLSDSEDTQIPSEAA